MKNDRKSFSDQDLMMRFAVLLCLSIGLLCILGCQQENPPATEPQTAKRAGDQPKTLPSPPEPPISEDFEGAPKLSLFPRVGDYQPELSDERHPYWVTFIDHLRRTSGLYEAREGGNKAWSFRSVNSVDSLGFFSPLKVKPSTTYTVSFRIKANLPENAFAGIGVLEFNKFLWVGEQYVEKLYQEHYRGVHPGVRLSGELDWEEHHFTFTTGPETAMIHLVLFREGAHDRTPVLFDDIKVNPPSATSH